MKGKKPTFERKCVDTCKGCRAEIVLTWAQLYGFVKCHRCQREHGVVLLSGEDGEPYYALRDLGP